MRRRLHLLNLALMALILLAGWQIRERWVEARERERRLLEASPASEPVIDEPALQAPEPVRAADYLLVAEKLLFARDRNPEVIIEVAAPKPVPPLPVAYGVLDLGAGPTVILSERPGQPQRAYRVGDQIGEFTLAEITATEVAFLWEGKSIRKSVEELKPAVEEQAPQQAEAPAPAAAPKARATVVADTKAAAGPSDIDIGGGVRACRPGDTSPPGTVSGGYRKVVTQTPFGQVCRWEPVK
jgi:hypothetical protein